MTDESIKESTQRPVMGALSAIAQALGRNILPPDQFGAWYAKPKYDLAIFSYTYDFEYLWGLNEGTKGLGGIINGLTASRQNNNELTVLIVWDGMPQSSSDQVVSVDNYLTPYDWAVALSIALYKQGSASIKLQILILDVASQQSGKSFIQQSFFGFHNVFPWIQDYRPIAIGNEFDGEMVLDSDDRDAYSLLRQAIPPGRQDVDHLIRDLHDSGYIQTTFSGDGIPRNDYLNVIVESWRQQFLRAGDRHKVANLIAPMVLAAGLPKDVRRYAQYLIAKNSMHHQALNEVLKLIDLLETEKNNSDDTKAGKLISDDGVFKWWRAGVRFMLIDDQCRTGYHHILACILFGTDYDHKASDDRDGLWNFKRRNEGALSCAEDTSFILNALNQCESVRDWNLPRVLDIPGCDVLLLDLRLWLESVKVKRNILRNIIKTCSRLNSSKLNDPAFKRAFHAAERVVSGDEVSDVDALVLLPLLISHYDPSLPVVLFSSTHQREVIELVSHRRNIITTFSKPVLSGSGEEPSPSYIIKNLRLALDHALNLHEMRWVWKQLPIVKLVGELQIFDAQSKKHRKIVHKYKDDGLKTRFVRMYTDYLQTGRYYDFISLPYEFLESALKENENFVHFNSRNALISRNAIANALKFLRHRKAHGQQRPQARGEENVWRRCAIIEFKLLLDFMMNKKYRGVRLEDQLQSLLQKTWDLVCENTTFNREDSPVSMSELAEIDTIPWERYFLYTVSFQLMKCYQNNKDNQIQISNTGWQAIQTITNMLGVQTNMVND